MKPEPIFASLLTASLAVSSNAVAAPLPPATMLRGALAGLNGSGRYADRAAPDSPQAIRHLLLDNIVDLFDGSGMAARIAGPAWKTASVQTVNISHRYCHHDPG